MTRRLTYCNPSFPLLPNSTARVGRRVKTSADGSQLEAYVGYGFAPIVAGMQITTTTGMIGLVNGQTAQLSVLNLNPVVTATPAPANCNVQLQFFDSGGTAVGPNRVVTNFAPQSAVFLDADRLTLILRV